MRKRILILIMSLSVMLCLSVNASRTDIEKTSDDEKLQVVQLLEIMNGDELGNMMPDAPVTRAEFVKMIINASTLKNAATGTGVSVFPDVTSTHWANAYISIAVKNGYINGYLDGTFKPENKVKLEEAVNVVLKLLGYTSSDFKGVYPDAQLAKYKEIDLDTTITAKKGEYLTRDDCMRLVYNMLCTKTKTGGIYCQAVLGYGINNQKETISLDALLDDKVRGPYINTADEPWHDKFTGSNNIGIAYYLNGKQMDEINIGEYDVYYYCEKPKILMAYDKKEFVKITAIAPNKTNPKTISADGRAMALQLTEEAADSLVENKLDVDDYVMVSLDKNSNVAHIMLATRELYSRFAGDEYTLLEEVNRSIGKPVLVTNENYYKDIPFDLDVAQIIYDGKSINKENIKLNDVLYYSAITRSVWVYREQKSGLLSTISPNKENPMSIVVGGKNYSLATDEVKYKLSKYGSVNTETVVTMILGKGDEVVDIYTADLSVIGDGENLVSYAEAVNQTLKGPYIVKTSGVLPDSAQIDAESVVIYKNNSLADIVDIKEYNVYYYSSFLNTMWLYDDTKSGIIEAISPNKTTPASVTLSGKMYTLGSESAKFALSNMGSFKTGDMATLILDKDGNAVGVVTTDEIASKAVYGIVVGKGDKIYVDNDGIERTHNTVSVLSTDAQVYIYQTKYNYDKYSAVKVIVGQNGVSVSGLTTPKTPSQAVHITEAIKEGRFAKDAEILDFYDESIYAKIQTSRISGKTVGYSDIICCEMNSDGEITHLILDNYTGDLVEYGILTKVNGSSYEYMINDTVKQHNSGDSKFTVKTGAAFFAISGGQVKKIGNLSGKTDITAISRNNAYSSKNVEYELADDVKVFVFDHEEYKYRMYDVEDISLDEYDTVTGYFDKSASYGGKIRVILASK